MRNDQCALLEVNDWLASHVGTVREGISQFIHALAIDLRRPSDNSGSVDQAHVLAEWSEGLRECYVIDEVSE